MRQYVQEGIPFFNKKFNENMLKIVLGYLTDSSTLQGVPIKSTRSKFVIEKCFMYVVNPDKDCFISSIRMVTPADLQFFDYDMFQTFKCRKKTDNIRKFLVCAIEHIVMGGVNPTGKLKTKVDTSKSREFRYVKGLVSETGERYNLEEIERFKSVFNVTNQEDNKKTKKEVESKFKRMHSSDSTDENRFKKVENSSLNSKDKQGNDEFEIEFKPEGNF